MSLHFLKLVYDSQTPLPVDESFYEITLRELEQDGVQSQVYHLLKQQGRMEQTPLFFQKGLKDSFEKNLFQNFFIKNQTDQILNLFENQGLDVIPIKGVYFAEKFFGHIGARPTSDIDLLIKMADVDRAVSLINSMGFSVEEELIPGHFHCSFSKPLPHSDIPLVVELHWSLVKDSTSNFNIDDLWCHALPIDGFTHIKELSPNHSFYMICLHGWRHNLDSLKYFLDMIQVLYTNQDTIDFDEILNLASSHLTHKRMIRTLSILYRQFPHLEGLKPLRNKRNFPLWEYHNASGFKKYLDFIDYQFFSYDKLKHSFVEFCHWLIPNKYEVSSEMNVNRRDPGIYLSLYKKRITGIIRTLFSH